MKYYSELLDKMFDTEKDLLRAESEQKKIKTVALNDQIESILEQMYALDAKSDELDEKLRELDDEYYSLTGNNWFENIGVNEMKDLRERAKEDYVVEIMGIVRAVPGSKLETGVGCVCCPTGPKGEPGVPEEPKCDCDECKCDSNTPETNYKKVANDHFLTIIEKEFPTLANVLRYYVEEV